MTLADETLSRKIQPEFVSSDSAVKFKQIERNNIAKLIDQFVEAGGKIKQIEYGVSGESEDQEGEEKPRKHRKPIAELSPITMIPKKNKPCGASGKQNIKKTKTGYSLIIAGTNYGHSLDILKLVKKRDSVRAELKMPPAVDEF